MSNRPGVDWYVPAVLLNVRFPVTWISVPYTGTSSCWDPAAVPFCALVTPRVVDSLFCVIESTLNISEPNW